MVGMGVPILETDPLDVLIGPDGDIVIDPLVGLTFVSGIPGVQQLIRIACLMFLGEWFLNQAVGIGWFDYILGENFDPRQANDALSAAILAVPGVDSIVSLTITPNTTTRNVVIAYTVACSFGDTASDSLDLSQVQLAPASS
jgi:hypothetical protein